MSHKKIVLVDYQSGNLFSITQALTNVGLNVNVSSDSDDIATADAIVLPGVGAFGAAMLNLEKMQLVEPIKKFVNSGKPFLGICLGLQLLFSKSDEFDSSHGLNIIKGNVRRFKNSDLNGEVVKVPQIAWNTIHKTEKSSWEGTPLFDVGENMDMYFVHSFYVIPEDKQVILSETTYGGVKYASSILNKNIFACQFHPEKSAALGLKIYNNWAVLNKLI
jgi:imidazole glycerol-phosphate synthase subunit HisH